VQVDGVFARNDLVDGGLLGLAGGLLCRRHFCFKLLESGDRNSIEPTEIVSLRTGRVVASWSCRVVVV
jgi:hypothetical protein